MDALMVGFEYGFGAAAGVTIFCMLFAAFMRVLKSPKKGG